MASIKVLAESSNLLRSIPSKYAYSANYYTPIASDQEDSIPVIDYLLLTSGIPDQRSKVIDQLGKACEEWGFFLLRLNPSLMSHPSLHCYWLPQGCSANITEILRP
ncbi:hypothetical protein RJ639_039815 [Escallonia herrerae]|uniref:Non-haem dioxygenase N-terminal domain-containing protein n=1 Tax=Escallonia herrerae TaxID=1293975 RepID=A0AA88WJK4_9ASTE|nr:hypothetical protein RJ639_039815 [Escallonia herrerae]